MNRVMGLLAVVLLAGCKKPVEVKQDSPTAAMASLVKLYAAPEADQRARVPEVLDPAFLRIRARTEACAKETLEVALCEQKQNEAFARCMKGSCGEVPKCAKYTDCTCGEKGKAAVAKAASFSGSDLDRGLGTLGLDPTKCTITEATSTTGADYKKMNPVAFEQSCADLGERDVMSIVTLACAERKLKYVLRESGGKWGLIGFDANTEAVLNIAGLGASEADKTKKKQEELNKDMK